MRPDAVEGLKWNEDAARERLREALEERAEALENAQSALAAAERANDLKDRFLSTVSHELRTPLNAILGWVQLLRNGGLTEEQTRHGLAAIERNARAQARLISDLLDVSHMRHGRLVLSREPIVLGDIVASGLAALRPLADAKGVAVGSAKVDTGLRVSGDPRRLYQVVTNLLSNAIKFTPPGGRVTVDLHRDQTEAVLTVDDTGEGIGADTLPSLFDRFFQGDTSAKRMGLGLGLVIVKELVELHGGSVGAASKGLGCGATFTVRLPLLDGTR
jgi:signal transduction histidine kinase